MPTLPDKSVDLTVTSPPYDNLRTYNGNASFDYREAAKELFRLTKDGGVVVWVVGDATINGSETGTSLRQALYFKEIGFNLHDTMIYEKDSPPMSHNRYEQRFEYMFVFSKGKPKSFNPIMEPSRNSGKKRTGSMRQDGDSLSKRNAKGYVASTKIKGNIWRIVCANGGTKNRDAWGHPAIFPEKLAEYHILSWSNKNDTILDPFAGSGTTGVACMNTGRKFILIEKDKGYCEIIRRRLADVAPLFARVV